MLCAPNHSLALALKAHTLHPAFAYVGLEAVGHGTDSRSSAFSIVCTAPPMASPQTTTPIPRKNCERMCTRENTVKTQLAASRCERQPSGLTRPSLRGAPRASL